MRDKKPLSDFLIEYNERNTKNAHMPVAVGRYGIREREDIYSKELAKDYSKNKLIFQNTLTLGMGSVQMDIGILTEDAIYSVSPAYRTYRIRNILPEYLRYCLEHRNQDMFVRYAKRGSRQGKTIDLKRWLTYQIPVYTFKVQKEISKLLDTVSNLIEGREHQLELLEELVKSRFVEMFGDPIKNEMSWSVYILQDLTEKIGSGATPRGGEQSYQSEGVALIRSMNVHDNLFVPDNLAFISEEQANALANVDVQENDVLLNITGASVARTCIVPKSVLPARVNQHVSILRCMDSEINPVFLLHQLLFPSYKQLLLRIGEASGATRQAITKKQIENLSVIVPPLNLQNLYSDFVKQNDKSKFVIQQSLQELETLKKALMQKYFG